MKRKFNSNRDGNFINFHPGQKMNNSQTWISRILVYLLVITLFPFGFSSCNEYLDKTILADINENDVFTTYDKFEGYVETMYNDIVDPIHMGSNYGEFNNGDDNVSSNKQYWLNADYWYVMGNNNTQYYNSGATRSAGTWNGNSAVRQQAIWQNSWFGIRAANQCLAHLDQLVDATDDQKKLIEGQALFFRGYFHWELMKAWGNVPFVDTVFAATDDMRVPQKGLYNTAEKIVADLQRAAELLPANWDDPIECPSGQRTIGQNKIRPCKGMALANMAECLLYCGSPLFNGVETGSYTYNVNYCKRAAAAAAKVIDIANSGLYKLEPWATYKNNFFRKDNRFPWTKEIIFNGPNRGDGRYFLDNFVFWPGQRRKLLRCSYPELC